MSYLDLMPLSRALDEIYVAISHRLSATLDRNIWWNMVAMRYRITHKRDINDITLERDWMKVFREYIKSRIEKAQLYVIFSKIYFSCFGKYVIVFRRRAPRSTKFLFRYIIGFIMCIPGPSLSLSLPLCICIKSNRTRPMQPDAFLAVLIS